MAGSGRIPVFVLTGFLGAGKTSLLNALLGEGRLEGTAVIVNEFGEIGLDHLFLGVAGNGIVEMSAGCLCCTIRGELAGTLLGLKDRDAARPINRVIIETTGLADPVPVLQAILADAEVNRHFELAGVVTLVDALNAVSTLGEHGEARNQVALADVLVVTKADMLSGDIRDEALARLTSALRELNPYAPMVDRNADNDLAGLFERHLWDPSRRDADAFAGAFAGRPHEHAHHHDINRHGDRIAATVIRHDRPIPLRALEAFLELIASAHGDHVLRIKGLVAIEGRDGPLAVHGVQGIFHEPEPLDAWPANASENPPGNDRSTRIVAITRDMDPDFIERLFAGFAGIPSVDTPDRAALQESPLAIPGFGPGTGAAAWKPPRR